MIVVSAGIVSRNGKIMLCQRKPGGRLPLKWEFPGGKLEEGETPQQALERELREELGISTRTGRIYEVSCHEGILLLFFFSEILSGEPETIDCNAIAWADPGDLPRYDLAPADRTVAEMLARELLKS